VGPHALVLLGVDALHACRRAGCSPRPGVIVVACAIPGDRQRLRRNAEALGARHLAVLPGAWAWLGEQLTHPPDTAHRNPLSRKGSATLNTSHGPAVGNA
jgi:hypothetical protein